MNFGGLKQVYGLQIATEVDPTTDQDLTLSGDNIFSGENRFTGPAAFGTRHDTNVFAQFGTGAVWRQYSDGTDLILQRLSGTGSVGLGVATARNDIVLGKIGLGDSAISANFFINFVGVGNNRGAMNFDFTANGTNIAVDLNLKATSQHTNSSGTSNTTGLIAGVVKDEDLTATTANNYTAATLQISTLSTRSISGGVNVFIGADISQNGNGTAHTGGTVNVMGIRVQSFANYAGVATFNEWSGIMGEDFQVVSDKKLILEGTTGGSTPVKGDSYFVFNAATTDVDQFTDGVKTQTWDNDQIDFHVPTAWDEAINMIFGTTTGTKIGTATTQKIGFWNKTPVVQPAAYTPTNVTTDRSYDANSTTIDEIADVLGTLIADLQSIGLVG